jgi:hypothetical protein
MAHLASGTHPQWDGEREYSYAMGLLKNRDIHHAPSYGNVSGLHNDWIWGLPHVQTKPMSCSKCQFDDNMAPAHRTGHALQAHSHTRGKARIFFEHLGLRLARMFTAYLNMFR